jgi:DNA-binding phage protein
MNDFKEQESALLLMLKEVAKAKGLTYQQIADKCGLQQTHVSKLLNAGYSPTVKVWLKLCWAVGVNPFFEDKDGQTDLAKCFEQAMEAIGRRPDKLDKN